MIIVPFCKCIVITREFKKEDGSVGVELCLTFKKGFVIGRSHCGHHMWRDDLPINSNLDEDGVPKIVK